MKQRDDAIKELLRELGESATLEGTEKELGKRFKNLSAFGVEDLKRMGLDLAVALGISGDWQRAHDTVRRYRAINSTDVGALVFEMRCLYELEHYSEVLALGQNPMSERHHLLAANYLMAMSFEALGMVQQARARLEAVLKMDPNFLDTPLRLAKLQGVSSSYGSSK